MIGKVFNCYFTKICDSINKNILIYGTTDYNCNQCKIKILKFVRKIFDFNDTFYIQEIDGTDLVQTKFDDYYHIMYDSVKTPTYSVLWKNKKVYKI